MCVCVCVCVCVIISLRLGLSMRTLMRYLGLFMELIGRSSCCGILRLFQCHLREP